MTSTLGRWQHDGFLRWYGSLILGREKEAPGEPVKITDDTDLLEQAFRAGWDASAALEEDARRRAGR